MGHLFIESSSCANDVTSNACNENSTWEKPFTTELAAMASERQYSFLEVRLRFL